MTDTKDRSHTLTGFQRIILSKIERHSDPDGFCRLTNEAIGRVASGTTRQQIHKEVSRLVKAGHLSRELDTDAATGRVSERRLRLTGMQHELR